MGSLDGRVCVITGAGAGMGRSHAKLFASEGASVVVADIQGQREVVDAIERDGGHAIAYAGDLADPAVTAGMIDAALDTFGGLHVVVNNAGRFCKHKLPDITDDEWSDVVGGQLLGAMGTMRAASAYWRSLSLAGTPPKGSIINITSASALHFYPEQAAYVAAKGAITALTMAAARELAEIGVRVNGVSPGARTGTAVDVHHLMKVDPDTFDVWAPENVSPLVAYLATAGCTIAGHIFRMIGGKVTLYRGWEDVGTVDKGARFTTGDIGSAVDELTRQYRPPYVDPAYMAVSGAVVEELGHAQP